MLLEGGAQVGAEINNGVTALHAAAQSGHAEVVRLLLEGGAQVGANERPPAVST